MGLRSVKENPQLAQELHAHILSHPDLHPGTAGFSEILDIQRQDKGWRVTVGLGNQGESGVDTFVCDSLAPSLTSFR